MPAVMSLFALVSQVLYSKLRCSRPQCAGLLSWKVGVSCTGSFSDIRVAASLPNKLCTVPTTRSLSDMPAIAVAPAVRARA